MQSLAFEWVVPAQYQEQDQFLRFPIQVGKIYPTIYVTREQFLAVGVPPNHRRFVIIRDLRDTLVSLYFSVKVSHAISTAFYRAFRDGLRERTLEDGLLYLLEYPGRENAFPLCAAIQESWLRAGEPLFRYENLLQDDVAIFEYLLLRRCELPVTAERLREVVLATRFEALTGGRRRGEEDVTAHERKGVAGDWQNHFTPRVKRAFKEQLRRALLEGHRLRDRSGLVSGR